MEETTPLKPKDRVGGCVRYYITIIIFFSFFISGLNMYVVGTTLLDMLKRLQVSIGQGSAVFLTQGIGVAVGTFSSGQIFTRLPSLHVLCTLALGEGLATFLIGLSKNIYLTYFAFFVQGFGLGAQESGSFMAIMELWGDASPVAFQIVVSGMGFGSIAAPFIVLPFLQQSDGSKNTTGSTPFPLSTSTSYDILNINSTTVPGENIEIPYYISAGICGAVCLGFFIAISMKIKSSTTERDSREDLLSSLATSNEHQPVTPKYIFPKILANLSMFFGVGFQSAIANNMPDFIPKQYHELTKHDGTVMVGVYWAIFTLYRAFTALVVKYAGTTVLLLYSIIAINIAGFLLLFKILDIWVSITILAIGTSPLLPGAIGWARENLPVTKNDVGIILTTAIVGHMIVPFVLSIELEEYGPKSFVYYISTAGGLSLVIVIIQTAWVLVNKEKSIMKREESPQEDPAQHENSFLLTNEKVNTSN